MTAGEDSSCTLGRNLTRRKARRPAPNSNWAGASVVQPASSGKRVSVYSREGSRHQRCVVASLEKATSLASLGVMLIQAYSWRRPVVLVAAGSTEKARLPRAVGFSE